MPVHLVAWRDADLFERGVAGGIVNLPGEIAGLQKGRLQERREGRAFRGGAGIDSPD